MKKLLPIGIVIVGLIVAVFLVAGTNQTFAKKTTPPPTTDTTDTTTTSTTTKPVVSPMDP